MSVQPVTTSSPKKKTKVEKPKLPEKILRIEPVIGGNALQFIVESATNAVPENGNWKDVAHHVELGECPVNGTNGIVFAGRCDCGQWIYRLQSDVERGILKQCRHIRLARDYRMDDWITKYVDKHGNQK